MLKEYWKKFTEKFKKSNKFPDPYAGHLNTERIKAYRRLSELYDIDESTIRDVFCRGVDWYKEKAENK